MSNTDHNFMESLTRKFLDFEAAEIKLSDWEVWEAIRFHLYYMIQDNLLGVVVPQTGHSSIKDKLGILNSSLKFFWSSLFNRRKVLLFATSRYRNPDGRFYDPNIMDIYRLVGEDSFIIDSVYNREGYLYKSHVNGIRTLIYKMCRLFARSKKRIPEYIKEKVTANFGAEVKWDILEEDVFCDRIEKKTYDLYFRFMRPRSIFIIPGGVQTGLFRSAKHLDIPVVELQHGVIYFSHLAYSYPAKIDRSKLALPKYLFTFSEFWTDKVKDSFPVDEIFVSGNSFASKVCVASTKYDLTFVSTSAYTKRFIEIIQSLYRLGYEGKICMKLHPQQKHELIDIKEKLSGFKNVCVIYDEISIKDVIAMSRSILVIQTTSAYEALDADKRVFILKELTYRVHEDIFEDPRVRLVELPEEILNGLRKIEESNPADEDVRIRYFDAFRENEVRDFCRRQLNIHV